MEIHCSVSGFFHEVVTEALKQRHMDVAETTEFYLVNLLSEFVQPDAASDLMGEEPLALRLAAAAHESLEQRRRTLKRIGDGSLYMTGFFADSLNRRLMDVDYYMTLGGSAYVRLAVLGDDDPRKEVYDDLGERFAEYVEVLDDIRARTCIGASSNVIRLYEQWIETKSEWAEKRLRESGLIDPASLTTGGPVD